MSNPVRNRWFGLALAVVVCIVDQAVKWLMMEPLRLPEVGQIVLNPIFNLTFTQNIGVSLGLFSANTDAQRWALVAMTSAIALVVGVWLLRERRLGDTLALGLVLGGAAGNIIDRARVGYVIDYADLHFGGFRPFLVFNLADATITIGVLIILARSFLSREKRAQPEIDAARAAPEM